MQEDRPVEENSDSNPLQSQGDWQRASKSAAQAPQPQQFLPTQHQLATSRQGNSVPGDKGIEVTVLPPFLSQTRMCTPGIPPQMMFPVRQSFTPNGFVHRSYSNSILGLPEYPSLMEARLMNQFARVSISQYQGVPISQPFPNEVILSRRRWESVVSANKLKGPYQNLRVMSYNVLSDHLLYENNYLYTNCLANHLDFSSRNKKIIEEIVSFSPTVVCLQEVDAKHWDSAYKEPLEAAGYSGHFIKRTGDDKQDGVAVFYKKIIFKLVKCEEVEYKVDGDPILDRDNVGLILLLEMVQKIPGVPSQLCVANTHLLFNKNRGDVKLAQLVYMLAKLDKVAQVPGQVPGYYHPTILCGDFNFLPHSELYKFLLTGEFNYLNKDATRLSGQTDSSYPNRISESILPSFLTHECTILNNEPVQNGRNSGPLKHAFNFISAYKHEIQRNNSRVPEVTTHFSGKGITVDYIFYTVKSKGTDVGRSDKRLKIFNIESENLYQLGRLGLLSAQEVSLAGHMPNELMPSDHLPVLADFALK